MIAHVALPRPLTPQTDSPILIVHADLSVYQNLRAECIDAGYEVSAAANREQVLACYEQVRPALVIVDATAADGSGPLISRELRAGPAADGTPILMLLHADGPVTATQALDAGASECLVLPAEGPLLRRRIEGLLERQRLAASVATSRARMQSIAQYMPDGILVLEPQGTIEFANPAVVGTFIDISRRKRAEEAAVEQRKLAEALRDTAGALNSTLQLDEVLHRILTNLSEVVPFDACNILLIDGDAAYVASSLGYGEFTYADVVSSLRFAVSELPNQRAMLRGQWVVIPDVRADPSWVTIPEAAWLRSYAGAPVQSNGRVIGFLSLDSATPGFFQAGHAERLQAFADQAGIAITNARLYEAVRRHAADLEERVRERTAALEAANEQLRHLYRLKSEFVSNVSHELRTPLTNIKLYLNLLQSGKPERQAHYLAILQQEADFVQRMIEALLDLSRLDLGTLDITLSLLDLNQLVRLAAQRVESLRVARNLALLVDVTPNLPTVLADPQLMNRVLATLIDNAFDYTPAGGRVVLRTQQETRGDATWVGMSVIDSGPGIRPEEEVYLFERFFRGESGHKKPQFGTGLGLALCREIVERHAGEIVMHSQPGRGSTFTVWLKAHHDAG